MFNLKFNRQVSKYKLKAAIVIFLGMFFLVNQPLSLRAESVRKSVKDNLSANHADNYQNLLDKSKRTGSVRIILNLATDFQPEGNLKTDGVQNQRQRIGSGQDEVLAKIKDQNFTSVKKFQFVPLLALSVDAQTLEKLRSLPEVQSIQEDIPVPPALDSSIPIIHADDTWAAGYTGAGQTIAILDTGVDTDHEFITGKTVSEACYSTTDAGYSSTTVCPNGQESQTGTGSGINCPIEVEGCSHGTHVAGIAAGSGASYSGVAKGANLIAIQVFSRFDDTNICGGVAYTPCALSYTSDQILGLERVYALKDTYTISSVNMSLGGGSSTAYCDSDSRKTAIDNLRSAGIATVIAAGNDGYWEAISAPACISTAVSVGASTDTDDFAIYSNIAGILDMVAPGSSITSSTPDNTYATWDGTSMATPHVAGAFAVIRSKNSSATVSEIENALKNTGTTITETWFSVTISKPRIDVFAALGEFTGDNTFFIKNSSYLKVASADENGNMILKGTCSQSANCVAPTGSFVIQNSSGSTVGYVDFNGNLCIETGNCNGGSANCNSPSGSAFIVKNSSDVNKVYIDQTGDLCLTGTLTQSGTP